MGPALVLLLAQAAPTAAPPYRSPSPSLAAALVAHGKTERRGLDLREAAELVLLADVAGRLADLDPVYLLAAWWVESRWRPGALGDGGRSLGLGQLQLSTARGALPWLRREHLLAPWPHALAVGLTWRRLLARYGRVRAPVVYTCGPTRCTGRWTAASRQYDRVYGRLEEALVLVARRRWM